MNLALKALLLLAGAFQLACVHKAAFDYDVEPGTTLARYATIALDPREQVWRVEGQHMVENWEYREAVVRELRAKGYQFVKAQTADLWLDIIAVAPGAEQGERTKKQAPGPSGRSSRRPSGQAKQADGTPMGDTTVETGTGSTAGAATERTVIVKVLTRDGEKRLWAGSVLMPPPRSGAGLQPSAADWMRKLLAPLPGRTLSEAPAAGSRQP